MSNEPQPESPSPKPKKPFLRPSRIVLWIIILAAIVVALLEYRARSARDGSYTAIDQALAEGNEKGEPVYKADLEKLLRGSPKREATADGTGEVFTWSGVLKSYRWRVEYGAGGLVKKLDPE